MNNIRNNIKRDFTTIPNALINDNELTDRARFLFCYMAAKPDDWKFYQNKISKDLGLSIDTIRKYISELEESGWLSRELVRSEGKFDSYDYTLNNSPCRQNTDTVKNHNGKKPTRENLVLTNEIPLQKNTFTNKEKNKVVENEFSTVLVDEIDETMVEIHHVPEYFDTEQKKPKEKSSAKKEKVADPAPITLMWLEYENRFADLNRGEKPVFHKKYLRSLKTLFAVLRERTVAKGIVPLNDVQPWCDFLDMAKDYLNANPKEAYLRGRFDPIGIEAEFNKWITTLNNRPKTEAEKWVEWGKRQGL
jgi:DNA-binding Lrp family transcriptional regulator